jgi:hypothetical protein
VSFEASTMSDYRSKSIVRANDAQVAITQMKIENARTKITTAGVPFGEAKHASGILLILPWAL